MMIRLMLLLALLASSVLHAPPANAVEPDEILPDPAQEARARNISKQLRCMVCQNQNIDSSNAELARDLRLLVRERITLGDTDEQVIHYIHDRYGDFVLMRPPINFRTWGLWLGPILVLLAGFVMVHSWLKKLGATDTPASSRLSKDEEARLAKLLEEDGDAL